MNIIVPQFKTPSDRGRGILLTGFSQARKPGNIKNQAPCCDKAQRRGKTFLFPKGFITPERIGGRSNSQRVCGSPNQLKTKRVLVLERGLS